MLPLLPIHTITPCFVNSMPWHIILSSYILGCYISSHHHGHTIVLILLCFRISLLQKGMSNIYIFIMYPTLSFCSSFSNSIALSPFCFWHPSFLYPSKWSHLPLMQSYPIHHDSYFPLQSLFTIRYLHWDVLVYIYNYDKPSMSRFLFLTLLHLSSSNQCI